jgi:site-specific DNA-methyltransferase (adenine-specific)
MSLIKSMVSSKSNEWETPWKLYNYLDDIFKFSLDPCCTKKNAKNSKFYTEEDDGLSKSWANEVVFMNPPYGGHTADWLKKAVAEKENNATTVCLIVSSSDRSYWHEIIDKEADEIWFLRGRIKFGESKSTAPFASAIVIFRPNKNRRIVKFIDIRKYHQ